MYYVYILASKRNGTLYVGVTNNLVKRVYEHKNNLIEGFTKKYQVHDLVYFEPHEDINEAILKEKRLKKWNRQWKIELIYSFNSSLQLSLNDYVPKILYKSCKSEYFGYREK